MKTLPKIRLLTLNLALVLLLSMTEVPASAYPWNGVDLGYGTRDMSGPGWTYDQSSRILSLNGYDEGPITVTGDLIVYSRGDVRVSGGLFVYDGGLTLLNDGDLEITGGQFRDYSTGRYYGGEGISARGNIEIHLLSGAMDVRGGNSTDSLGGEGILSSGGGMIRIRTQPADLDSDVYEGMASPNTNIQVWGGNGIVGGNAIRAGSFLLDANAQITGGSSRMDGLAAGRAVSVSSYGNNFVCGFYWPESTETPPLSSYTAFTATLTAGSSRIAAVGDTKNGPPAAESETGWQQIEKYLNKNVSSPHMDYDWTGVTPYSLRIYPKSYQAVIDGSGGAVNGQSSQTVRVEYPAKVDLSQYRCVKPGATLAGFEINGKTVAASASFIPTGDVTVKAIWENAAANIRVSASPSTGGTVSGGGSYVPGETAVIRATPNSGYQFVEWRLNGRRVSDSDSYTFTVSEDQNYTAVFEKQDSIMHGRVIVESLFTPYSPAGETVTLQVVPDDGYQCGGIRVVGPEGQEVDLSGSGNFYSFPMPAFDVTVQVDFVRKQGA